MLELFANRTYRRLFLAQIIALLGTGLLTVALGLLAWDLAGAQAGSVLGTALVIKMVAYIAVAPIASVIAETMPRGLLLITLDIIRAGIALMLPFVDQVWQIYVLIFLLQSSSAAFTPAFQATIPDILPDERDYTRALSLSRLAYDLETLISPIIAAALLSFAGYQLLFAGTGAGFLLSALLITFAALPAIATRSDAANFFDRTTRGIRYYLATPRLRGLLALNLAAASGGAMVIVNTVVYVQSVFQGSESEVAIALAMFGAGSIVSALLLPWVLETVPDRIAMTTGAIIIFVCLLLTSAVSASWQHGWEALLILWFAVGFGYSLVLTPSGRLLRRSCHKADRPKLFAAQFALSHACWLVTYAVAGWLGAYAGLGLTSLTLAGLAGTGILIALVVWPHRDPASVVHTHTNLQLGHPHIEDARRNGEAFVHEHEFVIDEFHKAWPSKQ